MANQIELQYVDKQSFPLLKDLCGEDDFVDNGGYDYCRIYVWYFIQKYGMNAFINVYTGKESIEGYLFPSFEKDAINNYITQYS